MIDEKTIKCKKCGNEMPAGSLFCDKCGAALSKRAGGEMNAHNKVEQLRQKRASRKRIIVTAAIVLCMILLFSILPTQCNDRDVYPEEQLPKISVRVTPEQYEKLSYGMTHDEVVDFLGEDGVCMYEGSEIYMWPGILYDDEAFEYYYDKPNIELQFSKNGNLVEIEEHNLIKAEEIAANRKKENGQPIVLSQEIRQKMKKRMSYAEIVEILGAEGLLIESESDKKGTLKERYRWSYKEDPEDNTSFYYNLEISFNNDKADLDD